MHRSLFLLTLTLALSSTVRAQDDWLLGPLAVHGTRVRAELKLNSQQDHIWNQVHEEFVLLRKQRTQDIQQLRRTMGQTLDTAEPDLSGLARKAKQIRDRHTEAGQLLQDRWLKLYAGFSSGQKGVISKALKIRAERSQQPGCP